MYDSCLICLGSLAFIGKLDVIVLIGWFIVFNIRLFFFLKFFVNMGKFGVIEVV